jgi:hypothetical protein
MRLKIIKFKNNKVIENFKQKINRKFTMFNLNQIFSKQLSFTITYENIRNNYTHLNLCLLKLFFLIVMALSTKK